MGCHEPCDETKVTTTMGAAVLSVTESATLEAASTIPEERITPTTETSESASEQRGTFPLDLGRM